MAKSYDVCVNGCVIPAYKIEIPNKDLKDCEKVEKITNLPTMERLIDPIRCSTPIEATQTATALMSYEGLACLLSAEEGAEALVKYNAGSKTPVGVVLDDSDIYVPDNITINGKKVFAY